MKANYKSRIYPVVLILIVYLVWQYRESNALQQVKLSGKTMGTIAYHITYLDHDSRNFKVQIDSLLVDFNQSLSTYISDSEISRFNNEGTVKFTFPYFLEVMESSQLVYDRSQGAFDPTIGQLIDAWGFGKEGFIAPDSTQVDSLLQYVGFTKILFNKNGAEQLSPGVKLNFSAIAKGQAIDVVGNYLSEQGIEHYMVEIGGEVRTKGKNGSEKLWAIGIEVPDENRMGGVFDAVLLDNQGMATSGNYRQFRMVNGRKVTHTIDPKTGFPKIQTLLSATVLAPDCMLADAYATACMVLGLEGAKTLILNDPTLEAYFIYGDEAGNLLFYISPGLEGKTVNALNAAD
jgi:thiamine biosynthesis lipoprotein